MKRQDLMAVAVVTLGTATLTLMTFWAGPMEAGGEGDANAAKFAQPKLLCDGVEISLAAKDGAVLKAGDKPVFELTARNITNQPAQVSVRVTLSATAPADKLSRTPSMPKGLWRCDPSLTLQPNETKTMTLATEVALPTNSIILVSLHDGTLSGGPPPVGTLNPLPTRLPTAFSQRPGIVALSFSTVAPQAQPRLASAP